MSDNQPTVSYAVDVVFCIDCTGSMYPYLDSVKSTAQEFHTHLIREMERALKGVRQLRLRVVSFRDLGEEGADAIQQTPFFTLPADADAFARAVGGLTPSGGGDEAESALEALAVAIRSDWERTLDKRRHVVVMCTDASAHPLGKFSMAGGDGGGRGLPTSMEELQAIWGDESDDGEMEYSAKRLIVFGPSKYPWTDITGMFENAIWIESAAGAGMRDQDQDVVIQAVAGSV